MTSILVFRVQDTDGYGPYNGMSWEGRSEMSSSHCDDSHMSPNADPTLGGISYIEKCGCDSPEALLRWFDGYWEALAEAGFVVKILKAKEARTGRNGQVVYCYYDEVDERDTLDIDTFVGLFGDI